MDYYDIVQKIFEDPDNFTTVKSHDTWFASSSSTNICIVKTQGGPVSLMTNVGNFSVDYDSNYVFRNPSSYYASGVYRFDWDGSKLVYTSYYQGGSYTTCQNIDGIIYCSGPINMYYNNVDRNINYSLIDGNCGWGNTGFDVTPYYPDESPEA